MTKITIYGEDQAQPDRSVEMKELRAQAEALDHDADQIAKLRDSLMSTFTWSVSLRGGTYWDYVYGALKDQEEDSREKARLKRAEAYRQAVEQKDAEDVVCLRLIRSEVDTSVQLARVNPITGVRVGGGRLMSCGQYGFKLFRHTNVPCTMRDESDNKVATQ